MFDRKRPFSSYGSRVKPAVAGLDSRTSIEFILHHLRNANLQRAGMVNSQASDLTFSSNEQFWESILHPPYGERKRIGLRWVELIGFQLVDWFPRAPGLYHTDNAEYARREAGNHVREQDGILFYEPRGKLHMLEGGIGSVRFKPISLPEGEYWLGTATSDNFCHSGVPIAIPNDLIDDIEFAFHQLSKITGQVKFLPEFLEPHFLHQSRIPQIYVEVNNAAPLGREKRPSVKVTPMVFFSGGRNVGLETNENVTYVTCNSNSPLALNNAVEWLEWYAEKYAGKIITNFDQQEPTFANAPFSLQNVMGGKVDPYILNHYDIENAELICQEIKYLHIKEMTMTKISVKLGDGTVVYGDVVVANSIQNSFNTASKADIPNDLKELLKELTKSVAKMSENLAKEDAKIVARDLENLTAEATSKTPRKQWWQLSVKGLTKAAKDIGEIGKPVLELAAKIVSILTVMPK
jgi:hypothetical protein